MLNLLAMAALLAIGLNRTPLWGLYFAVVAMIAIFHLLWRRTVVSDAATLSRELAVPLSIALVWLVYMLIYLVPAGPDVVCMLGDPRCGNGVLSSMELMSPAALSLAPWDTQNHLLIYGGHLVLFALAFTVSGPRHSRARFYLWLVMLALFESALAWLQWLGSFGEEFAGATGTLRNPNHFGVVMLFLFAMAANLPRLPRGIHRESRWLLLSSEYLARHHILVRGFVLSAVLLSFSRGAWMVGALSLVLWASYRYAGKRYAVSGIALMVFVVIGGLVLMWGIKNNVGSLLATDRFILWASSLAATDKAGLLGFGPGSYEAVYALFKPLTLPPLVYDHAHSDYLEVFFEQGWGGLLLMITLVLAVLWACVRLSGRISGSARIAVDSFVFGAAALIGHGAIDFPLSIPGVTALLVIVAGVVTRGALESRRG